MSATQRNSAPAAVTPMAFARAIEAAYALQGKAAAGALRLAQITPAQLGKAEARITARQLEALSAAAMQELDDEGLGAFRRPLPWGSYGMLARASLTAPDLTVALKRWCRHHGLLTDDVAITLDVEASLAQVRVQERVPIRPHARELILAFILRNVHGLSCWYVDSRIPLRQVRLPFARPAHADAYAHMFPDAALSFEPGAQEASIAFDARYLALPLRRDERAMQQMLQRALPLTVLQYRRDRLLVPQVRKVLATHPERSHSAESIAHVLHVSPRTLHRQLKEEGASLQQLKDAVRQERARDLLWRTAKPLKQVAAEVGFRNEKSFARAFRQWTGMTPGNFRAGAQ